MNILLFVTTLIMVMGIMTYAKLQTFISYSAIQSEFNDYMKNVERSSINEQAAWMYKNHEASKNPKSPNTPLDSLSRVNFTVFVDEQKRNQHANQLNQITLLTKRLIHILYHDQKFYQDALKNNPNILDTLLDRIYQAAKDLPKKKRVTQASDLANLNLLDPDLSLFLYKILNGTHSKEDLQKLQREQLLPPPSLIEERGEDNPDVIEDAAEEEYKTPTGYRSLLDFITMKDPKKIRIYLAPKELLLALFGDPQTVNAIIAKRNELYKAVTAPGNNPISPANATKDFQSLFQSTALTEFDAENYFDFTVSKTNPRTYD